MPRSMLETNTASTVKKDKGTYAPVYNIWYGSKLHKAYACVTWFKRKVLNPGLEDFFKLWIFEPRT